MGLLLSHMNYSVAYMSCARDACQQGSQVAKHACRRVCYMADDTNQNYSYTGSEMVVETWHPEVLPLKVCCTQSSRAKHLA